MQLIKSPWQDLFFDLVSSCKQSIQIAAPYVKQDIVAKLISIKDKTAKVSLLTRFKLALYHTGASDIGALEHILNEDGVVGNVQKLHAKIYIFDQSKAIVTSGNLTNGGLLYNYEYGVYFDEKDIVASLVQDYVLLSQHENTGGISMPHINEAKAILANVPKAKPIALPSMDLGGTAEEFEVFTGGTESILASLTGWRREVFGCLLGIHTTDFTIADINSFIPILRQKFPNNNNIEAKIRQQLQDLRDIGLVEFVGKGRYRKLWT